MTTFALPTTHAPSEERSDQHAPPSRYPSPSAPRGARTSQGRAIGALLGITRQRAQQIEAQATQRIRSSRLAQQLAAEVEERDSGSWDAWSGAAEAAAGEGAW